MIYFVVFLVLAKCDAMLQDLRNNRILIQRVNPNIPNNKFLISNQQICGQANFVTNAPSPSTIKRQSRRLNALPISTKYTRPLFDFMGKQIDLRESKSLRGSKSFPLDRRPLNQFRITSRTIPLQRQNEIFTMTQRLKAFGSTRNSFISPGTRNAGIDA